MIRFDFERLIENIVRQNEHVSSCCCVGEFDTDYKRGRVPIVFIVTCRDISTTQDAVLFQVQTSVEAELGERYWPKEYVMIEKLPLTSDGKVDYRTVEKMAEAIS